MEKFTVSNDPELYEAWPDVAMASDGRLVCVFSECTHHCDRGYTRIMLSDSCDRGRTWSPKRPLTEGTADKDYFYNCARITRLADGRLAVIVDRVPGRGDESRDFASCNWLFFSGDDGASWSDPVETPLKGIVPDKLLELPGGRWIIAAHYRRNGWLSQFMRYSDDKGMAWSDEITIAHVPGLQLCEGSILPAGEGTLVAFMRENSGRGEDCKKALSRDNGDSWGEVVDFPLPACHRPVAGWLRDGRAMITWRFMQGGNGWAGHWTQNFFGALTDRESVLATERHAAWARIFPIDYDRSPQSDLGYSGWVQFDDGEIYVVNYIVDDAIDKGQIRGYAFHPSELLLA